jgi:hypothetical protein
LIGCRRQLPVAPDPTIELTWALILASARHIVTESHSGRSGLPQAVADDLKVGKRPASMQPDEAAVYDLCMDLAKDHVVSDATFKKARELFSDQQIVDLITISGVYITLAMLSNTAEDATPGGKTLPLQPLPAG